MTTDPRTPPRRIVPSDTDGDVLTTVDGVTAWAAAGGGGGGVESVVAGTGITVDDTDPANPIVAATGGGGGGGSTTASTLILPWRSDGPYLLRTDIGTWGSYNTFTTPIGGGGIFNSTHAIGNSVAYLLYIEPGTYDLNVWGDAANSRAQVTYEVETADASATYTSLGIIDWYAAASTGFNTRKSLTGLTIAGTAGWRNLRCRVSGKNAAGSDYYQFLQALQLLRTA